MRSKDGGRQGRGADFSHPEEGARLWQLNWGVAVELSARRESLEAWKRQYSNTQ